MLEILLIIALAVSIFLDSVRIRQYIQLRKSLDKNIKVDFKNRIDKLYNDYWKDDSALMTFGEYCKQHWEEQI